MRILCYALFNARSYVCTRAYLAHAYTVGRTVPMNVTRCRMHP